MFLVYIKQVSTRVIYSQDRCEEDHKPDSFAVVGRLLGKGLPALIEVLHDVLIDEIAWRKLWLETQDAHGESRAHVSP